MSHPYTILSKPKLLKITSTPLTSDVTLFGKSFRERIVAVQSVGGIASSAPAKVHVYTRNAKDATVEVDTETIYPFFFLSDIRLLSSFPRKKYRFQQLNGHKLQHLPVQILTYKP